MEPTGWRPDGAEWLVLLLMLAVLAIALGGLPHRTSAGRRRGTPHLWSFTTGRSRGSSQTSTAASDPSGLPPTATASLSGTWTTRPSTATISGCKSVASRGRECGWHSAPARSRSASEPGRCCGYAEAFPVLDLQAPVERFGDAELLLGPPDRASRASASRAPHRRARSSAWRPAAASRIEVATRGVSPTCRCRSPRGERKRSWTSWGRVGHARGGLRARHRRRHLAVRRRA